MKVNMAIRYFEQYRENKWPVYGCNYTPKKPPLASHSSSTEAMPVDGEHDSMTPCLHEVDNRPFYLD